MFSKSHFLNVLLIPEFLHESCFQNLVSYFQRFSQILLLDFYSFFISSPLGSLLFTFNTQIYTGAFSIPLGVFSLVWSMQKCVFVTSTFLSFWLRLLYDVIVIFSFLYIATYCLFCLTSLIWLSIFRRCWFLKVLTSFFFILVNCLVHVLSFFSSACFYFCFQTFQNRVVIRRDVDLFFRLDILGIVFCARSKGIKLHYLILLCRFGQDLETLFSTEFSFYLLSFKSLDVIRICLRQFMCADVGYFCGWGYQFCYKSMI